MFDDLNEIQKALLSRALTTELNAIDSLMAKADKKRSNPFRGIFEAQREIVQDMFDNIYPEAKEEANPFGVDEFDKMPSIQ